jgi:hypothetical protein
MKLLADASVAKGQEVDELATIKAIKPQDEIETMLAAQMAVVHVATMTFARRLNHTETIPIRAAGCPR